MADRVRSNLGATAGNSYVHRVLKGMIYIVKKLRIEKLTMDKQTNKVKCKVFVEELIKHVKKSDMIIYLDEANFDIQLPRGNDWSCVEERMMVAFPHRKAWN
ncbi:hypothetical protein PC129_g24249 [Phytophthora cactorum]|uniref:Tc1-like transposase DDE domain-containing protein n=1 Tax=Phytophthora cactorum TaxID=29920 RepID=A0A329RMC3_9STRA|nr:hypothetical protein Pcac1_g12611 [Phytophthora cactorum]KAG2791186.1 hypothetical protein PC111_g24050 [Phytophthora cactorum]KAG2791616.1 hypothetical protein PC112_g24177 [Phytophthora cactorum]KAG2807852.1 hypothetical protein PC113_g24008 [Phytophthora cactorum]KAG2871123.1 hypothetical protein PC114_g27074 [Phytophthora cactorum]